MPASYTRALCKISGEALCSPHQQGYDQKSLAALTSTLAAAKNSGKELGLVIGAGNLFRAKDAGLDYSRTTLDEVGMLATIMNGKLLSAALQKEGIKTALFNAFPCGGLADVFSEQQVEKAFEEGALVLFTGGTGHPFFTTDTAAALRALQIGADVLVKLTTVEGIYTNDPKQDPKATRKKTISYRKIIEDRLGVMDLEAVILCEKHRLPIIVTHFADQTHLTTALSSGEVGTLVTEE